MTFLGWVLVGGVIYILALLLILAFFSGAHIPEGLTKKDEK